MRPRAPPVSFLDMVAITPPPACARMGPDRAVPVPRGATHRGHLVAPLAALRLLDDLSRTPWPPCSEPCTRGCCGVAADDGANSRTRPHRVPGRPTTACGHAGGPKLLRSAGPWRLPGFVTTADQVASAPVKCRTNSVVPSRRAIAKWRRQRIQNLSPYRPLRP